MSDANGPLDGLDAFWQGLEAFMGTGEDSYLAEVKRILEEANKGLPATADGIWEIYDEAMAPDFTLSAPDGCVIELDGYCSHAWQSPVRGTGMI